MALAERPAYANLVPNPSLETVDPAHPDRPEGWQPDSWGDVKASFQYLTSGQDGQRSLRVDLMSKVSQGDAKWLTKPFAVPAGGGLYQIGDSYRSNVSSELLLQVFDGAGGSSWLSVKVVPPASGWSQASGVVTLPPGTTAVQVAHVISGPGWLETDSYSMALKASADGGPPDGGVADAGARDGPGGELGPVAQGTPVSVVFDDGWASVYTFARPILKERGLRASHSIVAGWVNKPGYQSDYLVSDQIAELTYLGHEVGSHSLYHEDLTQVANLTENIVGSKRILEDFGFQVAGFVPPGGAYNDQVLELVKENYRYLRTSGGGLNHAPYDVYHLNCIVVLNTTRLSHFADWLKQAAAEKAWLILVYQRLGPKADYDSFVTPDGFREQMDYLVASGAEVRPVGEVLGVWTPAKPPPPVETGKSLPQLDPGMGQGCSALPGGQRSGSEAATVVLLLLGALLLRGVRTRAR
jgi:peptidoglycan/xylan/chitin deacetylase (PgdA/CDA1 family)